MLYYSSNIVYHIIVFQISFRQSSDNFFRCIVNFAGYDSTYQSTNLSRGGSIFFDGNLARQSMDNF